MLVLTGYDVTTDESAVVYTLIGGVVGEKYKLHCLHLYNM